MTVRFSWWGALALSHRWLGMAGCLLFILWFTSGIAMMYVRMPEVTPAERYAHLPALDPAQVRVPVGEAARMAASDGPVPVMLTMLAGRPVYRFCGRSPATVFADRPEKLDRVTEDQARAFAAAFAPDYARTLRHAGMVTIPDQWTLQSRAHLPLHLIELGDDGRTELYVSSRTGEVVMETTRRERMLAYLGPVAHWLYLPILRRNGPLWTEVIIWSSLAGCVLCVTGLVAGFLRFAPFRRFSIRGERAMSPYTGWMKWHHYAGLIFGVITLTWTFSGLLSMGPFPLLSSEGVTADQWRAVVGAPPALDAISIGAMQAAIDSASKSLTPKELSLITFRSAAYWIASESPNRRVLAAAATPERVLQSFDRETMESIAREAMPAVPLIDLEWLGEYDDYYYDRTRERPLPVLRARYGDAQQTWIYLDPSHGAIALVTRRRDRLNRWLYHGLHSLDVSWLHNRRPLWDAVVILLSLGGLAGAASSVLPAWRRLRRHGERMPGMSSMAARRWRPSWLSARRSRKKTPNSLAE